MTGEAQCPQCGEIVLTHALRCESCGYSPGTIDGWRPVADQLQFADAAVTLNFDAKDRLRLGAQHSDVELTNVAIWDFDGKRIDAPPRLALKVGLGPEIAFPGRRAVRLSCDMRRLGKGPATLLVYEKA
jgi:hypothetical protein